MLHLGHHVLQVVWHENIARTSRRSRLCHLFSFSALRRRRSVLSEGVLTLLLLVVLQRLLELISHQHICLCHLLDVLGHLKDVASALLLQLGPDRSL